MVLLGGVVVVAACGSGDDRSGVTMVPESSIVMPLAVGDRISATARVDPAARSCLNAWHIKLPGYEFEADPETVPVDWDTGEPFRSGVLVITDGSSASWFGATFSTVEGDVRFTGSADGLIVFDAICLHRPAPIPAGG